MVKINMSLEYKISELLNKIQRLESDNSKLSQDNSKLSQDNFKLSQDNFKLSQDNFKLSQDNFKLSQDNSKLSQELQTIKTDSINREKIRVAYRRCQRYYDERYLKQLQQNNRLFRSVGDTEITRKITATETTEVEHKGTTKSKDMKKLRKILNFLGSVVSPPHNPFRRKRQLAPVPKGSGRAQNARVEKRDERNIFLSQKPINKCTI